MTERQCRAGLITKTPNGIEEYRCELKDGHEVEFPGYGNDEHKEGDFAWTIT